MSGWCSFQWSGFMGRQVCSLHHHTLQLDCHISLSWCEFCGIFHNCGAVLWKMTAYSCRTSVCGSMLMLRMQQRKSLTRQCLCSESWEAFPSFIAESCHLLVGEHLIHLPGRYHWLFHCKVSHHSTSVKGTSCGGCWVWRYQTTGYPRFFLLAVEQ